MIGPRGLPTAIAGAAALAIAFPLPGLAGAEPLTDLHAIAVGMAARDLPVAGYRDVSCGGKPLRSWDDWASCPVDGPDGLRAVHVAYDQPGGGTKVAGHPVDLTVFFDGAGRLARIAIKTDDHAPPYLHKKAYELIRQTKAHYGEDGWTCKDVPASADEEPIGPLYVNEACTKQAPERRIEVSSRFFRKKGGGPRDYTSEASVTISAVPAGGK